MNNEPLLYLPDFCHSCGVFLQGGATAHKADCPIRRLIEEHFPDYELPPPPTVEPDV